MRMRSIVRRIRLQLVLLGLVAALHLLSIFSVLPSEEALAASLRAFFEDAGLIAVGVLSFTENLVGINIYFPGSIVILLAMSMTSGKPWVALMTFVVIVIPSLIAHVVNYGIGRAARSGQFGIDKLPPVEPTSPAGQPARAEFFLALWHPHTAAIVSIRAGATGLSVRGFLWRLLPSSLFWNTAWGILMYNFGGFLQNSTGGFIALIYIYILGWMAWDLRSLRSSVAHS